MAISRQKRGNLTYVSYHYRDGDRNVSVYCGVEGRDGTEEKIRMARLQHKRAKLAKLERDF